jgi:uncharacterized protein involved in exopolysaccharide biosynthesis
MISTSIFSALGEGVYRLRWTLLRVWNILCFRRWFILAVALGVVLWVFLGLLLLPPVYSSSCVISVRIESLPDDY